jgi:hypothetical protein
MSIGDASVSATVHNPGVQRDELKSATEVPNAEGDILSAWLGSLCCIARR